MSSTYNLEPPPTAKVLLQTTSGDIELELFAKQTPLTSRNFLQHCLDGYYDGTIFHRLVPGFVLQGGDPTGTGDGGESIYPGGSFADEFHSRLKFNRRGLLGMANTGRKDDNGSQFFITLGKADELTGKNTMFGRVAGDTIYNVMKMGEAELMETSGSEIPLYPTKIISAEILLNPFPDVVKKVIAAKPVVDLIGLAERKKSKKRKETGKALLSFGAAEDGDNVEPVIKKTKFNTQLVTEREKETPNFEKLSSTQGNKTKSLHRKRTRSSSPGNHEPGAPIEPKIQLPPLDEEKSSTEFSSPEPEQVNRVSSLLDETNFQIAELKASMKRVTSPVKSETKRPMSLLEELIPRKTMRGRKRKVGDTASNNGRGLQMLNAFKAKLEQAPAEKAHHKPEPINTELQHLSGDRLGMGTEDEEANLCDLHFIANCQSCHAWDQDQPDIEVDDPSDKSWMSHSLKFGKDRLGKDLNWKKQNEDNLVVIDPREKARGPRDEHRNRGEKGDSSRTWDQSRGIDRHNRKTGDRSYQDRREKDRARDKSYGVQEKRENRH